jgi:hypothetical protein
MAARHRQAKKRARGQDVLKVDCGECGKPAGLVNGALIYPSRPDLAAKPFWRCCACGAYIGCHADTKIALGTPAGPETRRARNLAHAAFDPLWRRKVLRDGVPVFEARGAAYRWLAGQIGTEAAKTHIGMMDAATAATVVEVCAPYQGAAA